LYSQQVLKFPFVFDLTKAEGEKPMKVKTHIRAGEGQSGGGTGGGGP